jgi:hypothetical protein
MIGAKTQGRLFGSGTFRQSAVFIHVSQITAINLSVLCVLAVYKFFNRKDAKNANILILPNL